MQACPDFYKVEYLLSLTLFSVLPHRECIKTSSILNKITRDTPSLPVPECARRSHIREDIMRMLMGYDTLINELGSSLSGGQKQRLKLPMPSYSVKMA